MFNQFAHDLNGLYLLYCSARLRKFRLGLSVWIILYYLYTYKGMAHKNITAVVSSEKSN